MNLFCNGSAQELPDQATVLDLILKLEFEPKGLAVAVNDSLVTRTKWELFVLQNGDRVTFIRAAQGG